MGIAAVLKVDADIFTGFGGESEQRIVRVRDQVVVEQEVMSHLSTPIQKWWNDVIFTCASFQPFRNGREADNWCRRHSKEGTRQVFKDNGFVGSFWPVK